MTNPAARITDETMARLDVPDVGHGARLSTGSDIQTSVWKELGITPVSELHAGHQSRVFLASDGIGQLVVKMLGDGHDADLVVEVEDWQVVCYPYIDGRVPRIEDNEDVEKMTDALASLHASMSVVQEVDLPPVPPSIVRAPIGGPPAS